ncbi:hypothetical protein ACJZ2D_003953 [Fusarium nematophilum]
MECNMDSIMVWGSGSLLMASPPFTCDTKKFCMGPSHLDCFGLSNLVSSQPALSCPALPATVPDPYVAFGDQMLFEVAQLLTESTDAVSADLPCTTTLTGCEGGLALLQHAVCMYGHGLMNAGVGRFAATGLLAIVLCPLLLDRDPSTASSIPPRKNISNTSGVVQSRATE